MEGSFSVSFSNRVETLYEHLKKRLFSGAGPFARRLVIVPSPAMKGWLMLRLSQDPEVGIAAGIDVEYLEEGFSTLYSLFSGKEVFPSQLEMSLKIEAEIRSRLEEPVDAAWEPVFRYLKPPLNRRSEKRLSSLSEMLAGLFRQYGKYGGKMVEAFPEGFQKELWERLFDAEGSFWSYPYRAFRAAELSPPKREMELHLFAISYVSSLQQEFLMRAAAASVPVWYYLLSPCQAFWSDLRSNRESSRLKRYWKNRGASEAQLTELEEYLRDHNPLLANYGKLGREMARQVEESCPETCEDYLIDAEIEGIEAYESLVMDGLSIGKRRPLTLLSMLQADMLLLRNPDKTKNAPISEDDRTVQIHSSTCERREIENLYDTLLSIIDREGFSPSDMIVMAPDIMQYEPYIKAVFRSSESLLDCQIMDLSVPSQKPLVQGFLHLASLSGTRWEASAVLELFECPAFMEKHRFAKEDLSTVRSWISSGGILWGKDWAHREELLKRDHCRGGLVEKRTAGTWEHGTSRLLSALIYGEEEGPEVVPAEGVSPSDAELLGRFISLMRSLYRDLAPIASGEKKKMEEWADYLDFLLKEYFHLEEKEVEDLFIKIFDEMRRAGRAAGGSRFTFFTVSKHLTAALEREQVSYREHCLHAVRFCSLLPMRAIPAKVVALIGMNEGAFPRCEGIISLDLLQSSPDADYCPSRSDYDRYLFLEALLSAREYFILSYVGYSYAEARELPPSILVAELLSYIKRSCGIEAKRIEIKHPSLNFNKSYFERKNFSPSRYRAACAFYKKEKDPSFCFVPAFAISQKEEEAGLVDLKKLSSFARNPFRAYLTETLGIRLPKEEEVQDEEGFVISPLDASQIYKSCVGASFEELIKRAERAGKLPSGLFKNVAVQKIKDEVDRIHRNLTEAEVLLEEIFEIEFSERCIRPEKNEKGWRVPALEVGGARIVGKIGQSSFKGLLAHEKSGMENAAKAFPEYLALRVAVKEYGIPAEESLILTRSDKEAVKGPLAEDSKEAFENYLGLYRLSLKNPSPLFPKALEEVLTTDALQLEEKIKKKFSEEKYDRYLKKYVTDENLQRIAVQCGEWKERAEKVFLNAYRGWFA